MRELAPAFLLASLLAPTAARADAVDDLIRDAMAKDHIPGVAVAVIRDGKPLLARGYGVANLETNTPVTPETVFRLASMSKQFCAESILMLAAEGRLSLSDPVSKHVDGAPDAWKDVTVERLLGHRSGIPDILGQKAYDFGSKWTKEDILALLAPLPLRFPPNDRFEYSNSNYYLLGWIVERASGKPLRDFAQERIFTPIGMAQTRYFRLSELIPNRANGYRWQTDHYENAMPLRPEVGDGSGAVLSTVLDWAKYDGALDAGMPVSKRIQAQMATPGTFNDGHKSPYGFAWYPNPDGTVHHTGSTHGFTSAFVRDPAKHLTVVVLRNSAAPGSLEMARAVLKAYSQTNP